LISIKNNVIATIANLIDTSQYLDDKIKTNKETHMLIVEERIA